MTLLILAEAVTDITPLPLASTAAIDAVTYVRAVGYGNTNFGGTVGYGTRRIASLPVVSTSCIDTGNVPRYGCDAGSELVAGILGGYLDTCSGDSGGPILISLQSGQWALAGATSRMTKEAQRTCGDGGIYTRCDKFRDWIVRQAQQNLAPASNPTADKLAARQDKTSAHGRAKQTETRDNRSATNRYVVYVHGICPHPKSYSNDWWNAMRLYVTPPLGEESHLAVWWSPIVHPDRNSAARNRSTQDRAWLDTKDRILDTLKDRAVRQRVDTAGDERGIRLSGERSIVDDIPGLNCADDFVQYLMDNTIRQKVKNEFIKIVKPLLSAGAEIHVISHSWGTVVAYEALCSMEADLGNAPGKVVNFFTVGSALSIGAVQRRLEDAARDGHRPVMVSLWINLNARFDIVGGHLQGAPFDVQEEYLGLRPVGCTPFIPDPSCSHGLYFNQDNVAVNRDIFGRLISQAP